MHFERSELQQLTPEYVEGLPTKQKSNLIEHLRKDLMQAQDRLNLNPSNSSKPPSSRAPWDRSTGKDNQTPEDKLSDSGDEEELPNGGETGSSNSGESNPEGDKGNKKRKPGKQPGAKGFGRTQKLAITREIVHRPTHCKGCSVALDKDLPFIAMGVITP